MAQTILITGANRGIGIALARELLLQGNTVIATSRNPRNSDELRALETEYKERLTIVKLSIDSDTSVTEAAAQVVAKFPALDVLVNNAAVFPEEGNESILDIDLQHFRTAWETNVLGTLRMMRAFLLLLGKGENPRIVNISSGAGSISDKDDSAYIAYAASKASLNMLTRAAAAEFKPRKITVVAVSPGWVSTEMGGPSAPLTPEQSAKSLAKTIGGLTMQNTSTFIDRDGDPMQPGW